MESLPTQDDWSFLKRFLTDGWRDKASSLGALIRKRKIPNADVLLRVLLIHLVDGKSLRTTSAYAKDGAVGKLISRLPPHRSVRALLTHTVPTFGVWRENAVRGKGGQFADLESGTEHRA